MKKQKWIVEFINKVDLPWGLSKEQLEELRKEVEQLTSENARLTEQLENSVQLPCKVGDTIYEIRVGNRIEGNCIFEHKVRAIHLETNIDTLKQHYYLVCGKDYNEYFWEERYKNYWFSTKPEAEARLKEMEEE